MDKWDHRTNGPGCKPYEEDRQMDGFGFSEFLSSAFNKTKTAKPHSKM